MTLSHDLHDHSPEAIAARFAQVRRRVDEAAEAAGRAPSEVRVLPVSKTWDVDIVSGAWPVLADAGCDALAENRVQEAGAKAAELSGPRWAVIGPLQTNKAGKLVEFADEFHALDRPKVARAVQRKLADADRTLEVFVQVNTSGEGQKAGFAPDAVADFVAQLGPGGDFPNLIPRGLMTMAMPTDGTAETDAAVRRCFAQLRQLRDELADVAPAGVDLSELSMGMSGDFELAIAEGATTVRVGTAIFGQRDYSQ
ncbi:YggS family pyridoxal phosphate-dependent enzyme [Corynebacterium sp. TAE3-ERU12]|uniref:YggS family pyridoxal phosphate-dependent enzyme n=1 Tax=Corynebacterium sp. TAE3-ERU12 TaxID=2849491 RepID=UPI001C469698|nr:YggS family pyridoxal phosphate-dependent enzyme [Corynebacterium sp. TAE3-ERU12]MBV7294378.1 YggS family pyridoxal phosphate-dependent enzyme [Corynebacterium sp. TAE3-ERU12]